MRKLVVIVAAAVAVDGHPADACSCVGPHAFVMGAGRDHKLVVPRNGQIRVGWPREGVKIDDTTVTLVSTAKSGPPVALDRIVFTTGEIRNVVLVPKSPLLANATYQVVASEAKGGKTQVLETITTTDALDATAPTWKAAPEAKLIHAPAVCCNCTTGDPFFEMKAGDASDDKTGADDLVWGVWAGSAKFDPKAPMLALREAYKGGLFHLGRSSMCSPSSFDVPTTGKTSELWIAPIDLAGNIGTPAKVVIDLTKPVTTRD
jgi:hypothetical protein